MHVRARGFGWARRCTGLTQLPVSRATAGQQAELFVQMGVRRDPHAAAPPGRSRSTRERSCRATGGQQDDDRVDRDAPRRHGPLRVRAIRRRSVEHKRRPLGLIEERVETASRKKSKASEAAGENMFKATPAVEGARAPCFYSGLRSPSRVGTSSLTVGWMCIVRTRLVYGTPAAIRSRMP